MIYKLLAILPTESVRTRVRRAGAQIFKAEGLKAKVFRGGIWIGCGSIAEQAARFGRNMILTRILAPEAFGAMAIILSATSVIQSFTDIGVREGLVQNPRGDRDEYVNVSWWLGVMRSLTLAVVLFISAGFIANFYKDPGLLPLLRVSSLALLLDGAWSPRSHVAMKQMKFGKLAAIGSIGGLCGSAVTVILSFLTHNIWALVLGLCADSAARCILSYIICPYMPHFRWSREASAELITFSRGLFGLSFFNLIFARSDIFVLGKLIPATSLGLYSMAVYLVQTPASFLMSMLGQTLMPCFSQIRTDANRTNRILAQTMGAIVVLGLPTLAFAALFGHSLLAVAYGSRYAEMAGVLILTSFAVVINILNAQITTVFYANGLPNLHRRAVFFMAFIMVLLIYPMTKEFGVIGAQLASLIAVFVGFLLQVFRLRRITGFQLALSSRECTVGIMAAVIVVSFFLVAHSLVRFATTPITISIGITGVLSAYALCGGMFLKR